ncbi:MAG: VanZ family protein [Syntrophomonas sp.]
MAKQQNNQPYIYQTALYAALFGLIALSWYLISLNGSQSNVYSLKLANVLVSHYDTVPNYIKSVDAVNWGIRKLANLIEYSLMSLALCAMLTGLLKKTGRSALATLILMSIWAVLDELHLSIVADRYSRWLDLGIDLTGVFIAVFLVTIFVNIRRLRMQNISLLQEVHLLTINQNIWDNLIPRLACVMEDTAETSFNEALLVQREVVEGGC